MAARARSVALERHVLEAEITCAIAALAPAVNALQARGLDASPALQAAGVTVAQLASPEERVSYAALRTLWENAADLSGEASFGARVATGLPAGAVDLIDYIVASAASIGDALDRLSRCARIFFDGSHLSVRSEKNGDAVLHRRVAVPCRPFDEFTVTLVVGRLRHGTKTRWAPRSVFFQHDPDPLGDDELRRILGCTIEYGARSTGIVIPHAVLGLPQAGDSRLLHILTRYADVLIAKLPARPSKSDVASVIDRARASIARQLAQGMPTLTATAKSTQRTPRTLQRQLAAQGTTFVALLDEVRRDLALKYVKDGVGLAEISFMLHFADVSAFHRAFKRWTRMTPGRYRARADANA
jgi:AraC-like DNA-binding protein